MFIFVLATGCFQPGGGMQMCEPSTRVVSTLNMTGGDSQYGWCRASIHRRQVGSLRPSCHCVIYSRQRVTSLYGDCLPDNGAQRRSAGWCSIFRHTEREGDRPDLAGGHPPFPYCFPIYFSGMTSLSPVCLISSLLKNSL